MKLEKRIPYEKNGNIKLAGNPEQAKAFEEAGWVIQGEEVIEPVIEEVEEPTENTEDQEQ